ncbi:MAG: host attachment protein [Alphaproteobacteria bacterium]|nr:host attachment protein [Alphaproteobacteria bacterium]
MKVPNDALVLVADGKKALFLRNEGDEEFPNLELERKSETADLADRDQKTDAPGRAHDSTSSGRSAYEETDFHQLEEDRFAAGLAELLKERALKNEFHALIVVAPARALGELRKHYHKEVEKRLIGELSKDLTGHPVSEIEKILQAE